MDNTLRPQWACKRGCGLRVAGLKGIRDDVVSLPPHQAASGMATRCDGTQHTDEAMFQTRFKREPGMQEGSSGRWMIWMMHIPSLFTFFFLLSMLPRLRETGVLGTIREWVNSTLDTTPVLGS